MNHFLELQKVLRAANVSFAAREFTLPSTNWYGYPDDILNRATYAITVLGGEMLFDVDGLCIASGGGDELSWFEVDGVRTSTG